MTYSLRDYQFSVVDSAFNFVRYSEGNGYCISAGGSGKSVMIAALAERLHNAGFRPVILARNEKLLTQNRAKLSNPALASVYCAGIGEKDLTGEIIFASAQSICNQILPPSDRPTIYLVDECHEIHPDDEGDTQYWKFFRANGDGRIIGFTATPFRTGSGLIEWGVEIINIPIAPLIKQGYILPPVNKVGVEIDLSQVSISMGEYSQPQLAAVYDDPELLKNSIFQILKYGTTRNRGLIFCQSLNHCDAVAMALKDEGQAVKVVSGDTCKDELNDYILPAHEAGEFKYLVNCQLLTTGVDMPWVDMIALLMATKSKGKFEQAVYRGTRLYEGKSNFLLLDMGNNLSEHGALGSPYRERGKREAVIKKGRVCPSCETWIEKVGAQECSDCGYVFEKTDPRKVDHAYRPDTESGTYYIAPDNPIQVFDVDYVGYKIKKSSKGNMMIVTEYHCGYGKYGSIADFFIPHHESSFVQARFRSYFKTCGHQIPSDMNLLELSLEQWIHEAESNLKKPERITVDFSDKHPKVINLEFPPEQLDEVLDFDDIPFI